MASKRAAPGGDDVAVVLHGNSELWGDQYLVSALRGFLSCMVILCTVVVCVSGCGVDPRDQSYKDFQLAGQQCLEAITTPAQRQRAATEHLYNSDIMTAEQTLRMARCVNDARNSFIRAYDPYPDLVDKREHHQPVDCREAGEESDIVDGRRTRMGTGKFSNCQRENRRLVGERAVTAQETIARNGAAPSFVFTQVATRRSATKRGMGSAHRGHSS